MRLMASRGVQLPSLGNFGGFVAATPFFNSSGAPRRQCRGGDEL